MTRGRELEITVKGNESDVIRSFRNVSKTADATQSHLSKFGKGASHLAFGGLAAGATAAGAAVGALGLEVKRSYDGYVDHTKVVNDTAAAIKSTGGAAGLSAKQVGSLADSLERKTTIDGDVIQKGENVLLTFTNLRNEAGKGNDVFNQTSQLMLDMSTRMGGDASKSAVQLGKALNDPATGFTALKKAGVSFTDSQVTQIKNLEKSGNLLGAQKIVLGELNKEFAGSAKSNVTASSRMLVSWHALEDAIGEGVKPAVDEAFKVMQKGVEKITPTIQKTSDQITKIFGRKDLNFADKIKLSQATIEKNFAPLAGQITTAIKNAHLEDKLEGLFEEAAPKIADAMASAAPHAAEAFINAFQKAGTWGKLLTVAFLLSKLGAFSKVGSLVADQFVGAWRKRAAATMPPAAGAIGAVAGKEMSTTMAATSSAALPGQMASKGGTWSGIGKSLGKALGIAAAAEVVYQVGDAVSGIKVGPTTIGGSVKDAVTNPSGKSGGKDTTTNGKNLRDLVNKQKPSGVKDTIGSAIKGVINAATGKHQSLVHKSTGGSSMLHSGGIPADVLAAAEKYGPMVDGIAAQYGISGTTLLLKLSKGESSFNPNAVSPAGARGLTQFMPGSRSVAMSKYGVDPWADADQAFHGAALHLLGKINGSTGLTGYNPGDPSYPSYILNQQVGNYPSGSSSSSGVVSEIKSAAKKPKKIYGTKAKSKVTSSSTGAKMIEQVSGAAMALQAYQQALDDAELDIAQADAKGNDVAKAAAQRNKLTILIARKKRIQKALTKKGLTPAKRASLTEELTGLYGDISGVKDDLAPPTVEAATPMTPYEVFQSTLDHIDLLQRAGHLSKADALSQEADAVKKALAGGFGSMSGDDILNTEATGNDIGQQIADLQKSIDDNTQAQQDATAAAQALAEQQKAAADALEKANARYDQVQALEKSAIDGAVHDWFSGMVAQRYQERSQTAGSGVLAHY